MSIRVILDTKTLDTLATGAGAMADESLGMMAALMTKDVIQNFSRQSPSVTGSPPGVATGLLKNSIRFERYTHMIWWVTAETDYATHLEYGTVRMAARPFMRPALRRLVKHAMMTYRAEIQKRL